MLLFFIISGAIATQGNDNRRAKLFARGCFLWHKILLISYIQCQCSFLHNVLYTIPLVLTKGICLTVKSSFSEWSFLFLFSWPQCLIQHSHMASFFSSSSASCSQCTTPFIRPQFPRPSCSTYRFTKLAWQYSRGEQCWWWRCRLWWSY